MVRAGIIGCGNIAGVLAPVMKALSDRIDLVAAASRDIQKAEDFASRFAIRKAYGSYEELYEDEEVDLVYVATPHSHHYSIMKDALTHGKHVLCEKAFCVNASQAEEIFALAMEKNLYVAEAIWTRYMPSRKMINDIIASGKIGKVRTITANLGYKILHKPRIAKPELAGGALLDIGVYPLNFALMAREGVSVREMRGSCIETGGVDARDMIEISFADGSQAVIFADAEVVSDRMGKIYGTDGYIEVVNVNNPERISVYSSDRNPVLLESHEVTHEINGYEYELISAAECIEKGLTEDPNMPHSETLRVLRYTDALRELWGIRLADEVNYSI